eukprot:TRINITY_DN6236_c0_g1_i2.p1 TRINITY_DN6236_c0_g1~~TRINITY_DN6236_c0_g1_i2.p1  ORF type:complete len:172 (-),score=40.92 TRINITY_DN6236_c0_g1_i2:215-730(-)
MPKRGGDPNHHMLHIMVADSDVVSDKTVCCHAHSHVRVSDVKASDTVLLHQRACRVTEVARSGLHHRSFVGIDIITGKKHEKCFGNDQKLIVPTAQESEYVLLDIDEDGFCSVMDDDGEVRSDLKVPDGNVGRRLRRQFKEASTHNEDLLVTVIAVMGEESVVCVKEEAGR